MEKKMFNFTRYQRIQIKTESIKWFTYQIVKEE